MSSEIVVYQNVHVYYRERQASADFTEVRIAMDGAGTPSLGKIPFDALFNKMPTPVLVISPPDWIIVAANDARLRATGTNREDQIGRKLFEVFPDDPADPEADGVRNLTESLERVMATGTADIMKLQRYSLQDAKGQFEERWWTPVNTPILGDRGEVILILHQVEDVTDIVRLQGEAADKEEIARDQKSIIERLRKSEADVRAGAERLRSSEEFSKRVLASSADCIKVLDLDARLEFMTEGGMCVMEVEDFGAIKGSCWPDFWQGDGHVLAHSAVDEARQGRTGRFGGFATTIKGTPRWWDVIVTPINGPDGRPEKLLSVSRDVTVTKEAEASLRRSEEQLRLATDAAEIALWDLDVTTNTLFWPPRLKAMFGISPDVPITMDDFYQGLHPDDAAKTTAAFATALDPMVRALYDVEYRTVGKEDGKVRWIAAKGRGQLDDGGRCVRVIGTAIEITSRKRTEIKLQELNADLERQVVERTRERGLIWQHSLDLLSVIDMEMGTFDAVNPAWSQALGWATDEFEGRPYQDFVHPEDLEASAEAYERVLRGDPVLHFENRYRTRAGDWRWLSWVAVPESGKLYSVTRDVTVERERTAELQLAQEALRQAQKMEAVGQLTGGIAHDFNNLLVGISGSLEAIERRIAKQQYHDLGRFIEGAQGSARRAASLTQRLLAFSRRQTLDPKPTDVNRLIQGMDDLIRRSIGPDILLEVVGAGGLWPTLIDAPQLENALLNLCINARDAMSGGGRLTIETANKWLDDREADKREMVPGQYLSLCVTDTGTGMPPEVIDRAFDPFFTTKPIGQGTGLGLSMIYGFVRQSGGQVRIYSEEGQGTTMCLYLPRFAGTATDDEIEVPQVITSGDGEVVLVIDDEALIRMLIVDELLEHGYQVLEAADGQSGLNILSSAKRVDLLITDVGLPGGMNGRQVADAAREAQPGLKVLFVTGYAENAAVGNGHLDPGMEVLTKPFLSIDLIKKVRDLIT